MDHDDEGNTDDLEPSPGERGDALSMIKKFARNGFVKALGSSDGFEDLWRTAFNVENPLPKVEGGEGPATPTA
jgi:hypothetical protein